MGEPDESSRGKREDGLQNLWGPEFATELIAMLSFRSKSVS